MQRVEKFFSLSNRISNLCASADAFTKAIQEALVERTSRMRFAVVLFAAVCLVLSAPSGLARASIYDSNVVQHLQLSGTQKHKMQKVIVASRARRNSIFRKYGINPNAKPEMGLLMRASSELRANGARERAAAKKILSSKQLRLYDAIVRQTRQRIMASF
jgi:hypothetical protein